MQFKRYKTSEGFCCLLGEKLIFIYEEICYTTVIKKTFSNVEFLGYKWVDSRYRENIEGVKILMDDVKRLLTQDYKYNPLSILEKMFPETYDLELLQTIQKIVGEKETEYDPDDCYGYNSKGDITLKSQLVEITTKHAREIAVLKMQPSILSLVEEVDKLKRELANSKDEIARATEELEVAKNKNCKLEQFLKVVPDLESQVQKLLCEREMFKEDVLQRVRTAMS